MAAKKYNMGELCISFLTRNRYYTCFLSKLNKVANKKVGTAGVGFSTQGKLVLYYNEEFFENLNLAQAQAILEHEILHITFKHLYRLPMDERNAQLNKLQNLACDMAINQYLQDLPEGAVYPETFNLPREMFAEWYLAELKKLSEKQQQQQGKGDKGDQGDNPEDHDTLDDHDLWGKTIDEKGEIKDASESEACDIEHEIDKIVRQAAKDCENDPNFGNLPAGIQKELIALRNPPKKHDWKRELKIFINTVLTVNSRLSQKKVNRRFTETVDYILPGLKKDRKPKLLVARDTSGSVFNDEMQTQFLNEMINISKFCEVIVADCDTEVHQTYKVRRVDDFRKYEGGGGTAFEPVFIEAKKQHVDGIIYLTDTEGSFPNKEDIGKFAAKTIWVTVDQKEVTVPFGRHVNISETK